MTDATDGNEQRDDLFARGMQARREVLGDAHVDRAVAQQTALDRRFQRFITESAWGMLWSDESIDRRTRSMMTIGILAALGREQELKLHLRATRANGVSIEDLEAALLHVAIYAGVPAANNAFALAKAELGLAPEAPGGARG